MDLLHKIIVVATAALATIASPPAPNPTAGGPARAAAQPAVTSGFVILRSIGPSARRYPTGQRLPSTAKLSLRPGDTVTVVQDDRFVRSFRGPGVFAIRMRDPSSASHIAGAAGPARTSTGAVRGGSDANQAADPALSRFIVCPQDARCPR